MANTNSNRKQSSRSTGSSKATKTTKTRAASARAKTNTQTKKVTSTPKATKNNEVKTSAAKATTKTVTLTPLERLKSMHLSSAFLYVVMSAILIWLVNTASVAVTLGIQARDEFASRDHVVLGPAHEVLYNVQPKVALIGALLVSALASVLLATKLRKRYENSVSNGTSGLRWVAFGLSSALTITFVNLLVGVNDFGALKLSAGLIFLTAMFSWLSERDNVGAVRSRWLAYVLAFVAGIMAWIPALGALIGTTLYGDERYSWAVYAISAVALLGFAGFAWVQRRSLKTRTPANEYASVEARYMRTDLITKVALVILTYIAFNS